MSNEVSPPVLLPEDALPPVCPGDGVDEEVPDVGVFVEAAPPPAADPWAPLTVRLGIGVPAAWQELWMAERVQMSTAFRKRQ